MKVQKFAVWLDPFVQSIQILRWKSTEALCLMTLKSDAMFEEKLTLGFKMTWGIWWILMRAVAGLEISTLMYYICQKHIKFQPKQYRRIVSHDTGKRSKLWRKTDFLFEKWHEEFWWTLTWAVESLKICTFVENTFYENTFYVWAKKIQSCVVNNNLWFQNDISNLVNLHTSSWK